MTLTTGIGQEHWTESSQAAQSQPAVNIGKPERLLTAAAGGVLALWGIRRSLPGLLIAGAGGLLLYRAWTGHCDMYEAFGIDTNRNDSAQPDYFQRGIHVEESCTVNKDPQELYAFWRSLENLPRIMSHLESVTTGADGRSHWVARGPAGASVEWDAEIINDEPGSLIAWQSLPGADVDNTGSVRFLPTRGGTEVKVVMDYIPPAGQIGKYVAMIFGKEPGQQIRGDLEHFKKFMETGEIPTAGV
jgi:uncharacterized membrane protein